MSTNVAKASATIGSQARAAVSLDLDINSGSLRDLLLPKVPVVGVDRNSISEKLKTNKQIDATPL